MSWLRDWRDLLLRFVLAPRAPSPRALATASPGGASAWGVDAVPPPPRRAEEGAPLAERQRARRKAVMEAFNPLQPVENRFHLLGRERELRELRKHVLDMGAHVLVYGPRGAGKTSLARAFGDHADEQDYLVLYLACGGDCDFAALFQPYLDELIEALPMRGAAAALRGRIALLGSEFGPRALASLFASIEDNRILLIVDEFDRIESEATRNGVAALLKLLSDSRAAVQLLLVGIAGDMTTLIDAHPSLRRHLAAVPLGGFDAGGVADLFARGMEITGIDFPIEVQARIAALAAGSPYHLRLFCFSAATLAIERGSGRVDAEMLDVALAETTANWALSSPVAASLFAQLAADPSQQPRLRDFALAAISRGEVSEASAVPRGSVDLDLFAQLAPVLRYSELRRAYVFDDSLAPQFLLVACHLAGRGAPPSQVEARGSLTLLPREGVRS